jgi:hypothetical protein
VSPARLPDPEPPPPANDGHRTPRAKALDVHLRPLDELRHAWIGPDWKKHAEAEVIDGIWVDRECKLLTVLLLLADNGTRRVQGCSQKFLARKSRQSKRSV